MDLRLGIEFAPEGNALLKFLKELQSVLAALQIDKGKLSIGDLEKEIENAGGSVEELMPVFRLLADGAEEFSDAAGESFLSFDGAIGEAQSAVEGLIKTLDSGEIDLPEFDAPEIEQPEFDPVEIPVEGEGEISDAVALLEKLRDEQRLAMKAMEEAGDTGSEAYQKLKEEIRETEEAISKVSKEGQNGSSVFEKMFNFEAIGSASEFLGGISEKGQEARQALNLLESSAAATGVSVDSLKESAADLFANKGAESYAESLQLIAAANKAVGASLKGDELTTFATGASAIAKTMDADVNDVLKKSSTFIKAFGLDGQEAYDLMALGAQKANTPSDDLLDTLSEYSPLMKNAGFSGEEFLGTLTEGAKEGVFNLDKIGDAIKETQVRLNAGDISNAFADLGDVPEELQDKLKASLEKATAGDISVKEFLLEATKATNEAKLTDEMKAKIQTAISGTPAEDIGTEIYGKIFGAPIDTQAIKDNALLAGEQVKQSLGDVSILDKITAGADVAFENIAAAVAPIASPLGDILGTVGQLGPGLTLLEDKFGLFTKLGGGIKDIALKIIGSVVPALGAQTVATGAATTATAGLNATMLLNPAFLVVAGIAALAGAFILFGDDVKDAETAVADVNAALSDFEKKTEVEKATNKQSESLRKLADEYDALQGKTDAESQKRFAEVSEELAARVPSSVNAIENLGTQSEATARKIAISTKEVKSLADENQRLAQEAREESLENLGDQAAALADSYKAAKEEQQKLREERDELLAKKDAGLGDATGLGISGDVFDSVNDQLKDVRSELGKASAEAEKAEQGMRDFAKRMTDAGKSSDEIAEALGITKEEAKKLTGESIKAKAGMKGVAGEAKGLEKNIDAAAKKAQELGKKFADARKEAADLSATSINALAQDLLDLEAAKKSGDAANIAAAEARVKISRDSARESVKASANFDRYLREAEIQAGKTKREVVQKETKEIVNAATEVQSVLFGLTNQLTLQNKAALEADLESIRQREEAELQALKDKAKSLRDVEKDKTKILQNAGEIKELEEGGKAYLATQAKFNFEREKAQREFYTKLISEQSKLSSEAVSQEIAQLEFSESELTDVSDSSLEKRLNLRLKKLALQQALETRSIVEGSEEYIAAFVEAQQAIAAAEALPSDATAEEKTAAEDRVKIARERLQKTEEMILQSSERIKLSDAKFEKENANAIAEIRRSSYERQLKDLEEKQSEELEKEEKHAAAIQRLVSDLAKFAEESGNVFIDSGFEERSQEIEREFELRIITEEEKQSRLTALQQNADKQRLALQQQALGASLEAERQAALKSLEIQRTALLEKIKLAKDSGQTEQAELLKKDLGKLNTDIEEKGSILIGVSTELQSNITDIFSNLFTGDEEKMKQPFRNAFNVLVGALSRLASAKLTQVLLDSILPGLGLAGFFATMAAKSSLEGLVNSFMQPILQSLLSFPTGGVMKFDSPTLLQVGDGARLGGINREYIFRDDQLRQTIRETVHLSKNNNDKLLSGILHEMKNLPKKFIIMREEIYEAVMQAKYG